MQFVIEKAKIVKKDDTLELDFLKTDSTGKKSKAWEAFTAPVHQDLKQAFENLAVHLAVMAGHLSAKSVKDIKNVKPEIVEGFHVRSFSIGGGDDAQGVVISGHKILSDGKAANFNTPFYRFEESEQTRYVFMDDLQEKLDRLDKEMRAYIDGSKRGANAQLSLFDPNQAPAEKVTKVKVLPEEKKAFKEPAKPGTPSWPNIDNANPDAMRRVSGVEDAEVVEETKTEKPAAKAAGRKKVAQSAQHPSGEVEEK